MSTLNAVAPYNNVDNPSQFAANVAGSIVRHLPNTLADKLKNLGIGSPPGSPTADKFRTYSPDLTPATASPLSRSVFCNTFKTPLPPISEDGQNQSFKIQNRRIGHSQDLRSLLQNGSQTPSPHTKSPIPDSKVRSKSFDSGTTLPPVPEDRKNQSSKIQYRRIRHSQDLRSLLQNSSQTPPPHTESPIPDSKFRSDSFDLFGFGFIDISVDNHPNGSGSCASPPLLRSSSSEAEKPGVN